MRQIAKMKMKKIAYIMAILIYSYSYSQTNLVPNPSFESFTNCPTTLDQTSLAIGWSPYRGSTDYYNSCNSSGIGVPTNGIGFQNAASGNAYAGFIAYDVNGFAREILGCKLTQTLNVGQTYYISLKFSLAEFDAINKQYVACNKVGLKFSTTSYQGSDAPYPGPNAAPINNISHVYSNVKISDTLNWIKIEGSFIADQNYEYVMIGNFFDDANTDTTYRLNGIRSYFFVDDVCVSTSSATCLGSTGINEGKSELVVKVYLDQITSLMKIETIDEAKLYLSINDVAGKAVLHPQVYISPIDLSNLSNGVYFVNIVNDRYRVTKKIIINH